MSDFPIFKCPFCGERGNRIFGKKHLLDVHHKAVTSNGRLIEASTEEETDAT